MTQVVGCLLCRTSGRTLIAGKWGTNPRGKYSSFDSCQCQFSPLQHTSWCWGLSPRSQSYRQQICFLESAFLSPRHSDTSLREDMFSWFLVSGVLDHSQSAPMLKHRGGRAWRGQDVGSCYLGTKAREQYQRKICERQDIDLKATTPGHTQAHPKVCSTNPPDRPWIQSQRETGVRWGSVDLGWGDRADSIKVYARMCVTVGSLTQAKDSSVCYLAYGSCRSVTGNKHVGFQSFLRCRFLYPLSTMNIN